MRCVCVGVLWCDMLYSDVRGGLECWPHSARDTLKPFGSDNVLEAYLLKRFLPHVSCMSDGGRTGVLAL